MYACCPSLDFRGMDELIDRPFPVNNWIKAFALRLVQLVIESIGTKSRKDKNDYWLLTEIVTF